MRSEAAAVDAILAVEAERFAATAASCSAAGRWGGGLTTT